MKEIKEKKQCAGKKFTDWHTYPCSKNAMFTEDGKDWCGIHTPSKIKERDRKRADKYKTECEARNKRAELNDKRRELKVVEEFFSRIRARIDTAILSCMIADTDEEKTLFHFRAVVSEIQSMQSAITELEKEIGE